MVVIRVSLRSPFLSCLDPAQANLCPPRGWLMIAIVNLQQRKCPEYKSNTAMNENAESAAILPAIEAGSPVRTDRTPIFFLVAIVPVVLALLGVAYFRRRGASSSKLNNQRSGTEELAVSRADQIVLRSKVLEKILPSSSGKHETFLVYDPKKHKYLPSKYAEQKLEPCGICLQNIGKNFRRSSSNNAPTWSLTHFDLESCHEDVLVTKCSHAYHRGCIMDWVKRPDNQGQCPSCREPIWDSGVYFQIETSIAMELWEKDNEGDYERQFYMDVAFDRQRRRQKVTEGSSSNSLLPKTSGVKEGALSKTFVESESWRSDANSHLDSLGGQSETASNTSSLAIADDGTLPDIELAIDGTPYTEKSHRKEAESLCEDIEVVLSS